MKERDFMRVMCCAALLLLLGVSGYLGASTGESVQTVSVPVVYTPIEASYSVLDTRAQLEGKRNRALEMLESVLLNPQAKEEEISAALFQKTRIAAAMEREAQLEKALAEIGAQGASCVIGEETLSVFAPEEAALNERMRVQMLDLAASLTSIPAERIKIILVKK